MSTGAGLRRLSNNRNSTYFVQEITVLMRCPKKGETLRYRDGQKFEVVSIEGNLCWIRDPDGKTSPLIWRFWDGLNVLFSHTDTECVGIAPSVDSTHYKAQPKHGDATMCFSDALHPRIPLPR